MTLFPLGHRGTETHSFFICLCTSVSLCTKIISILAPVVVFTVLFTGCNAESALKKGDQFYARGEYYDAAAEYKRAYSRTPLRQRSQRGERALKMADCYRRINYTAKAVGAYQNAIRYTEKATSDRVKAQKAKQDLGLDNAVEEREMEKAVARKSMNTMWEELKDDAW